MGLREIDRGRALIERRWTASHIVIAESITPKETEFPCLRGALCGRELCVWCSVARPHVLVREIRVCVIKWGSIASIVLLALARPGEGVL